MSRETLDEDDAATQASADGDGLPVLALDDAAAHDHGTSRPAVRRSRLRRLALAAATLAVVVLAVAAGVLAGRQQAGGDAADAVRLIGSWRYSNVSSDQVTVRLSGNLFVLNAGPDPVEVLGAEVLGVPTRRLTTPTRIEPGAAALVPATVELPCEGDRTDGTAVDVRVVTARSTGPEQQVPLRSLDDVPGPTLSVDADTDLGRSALDSLCGVISTPAVVDSTVLEADGSVHVDLRSTTDGPAEVFITLTEGSGAQVDGENGASTLLDPRGSGTVVLDPVIVDCESARTFLGDGGPFSAARTRTADGVTTARLDGWDDAVLGSALGFAVARDCG